MKKVIIILLLIATITLSAQERPNTVVHSAKRGFGWQMGKRAGNDAYDAFRAEGKKVVNRFKKKKKTTP